MRLGVIFAESLFANSSRVPQKGSELTASNAAALVRPIAAEVRRFLTRTGVTLDSVAPESPPIC